MRCSKHQRRFIVLLTLCLLGLAIKAYLLANWRAQAGNRWLVPVGGGVGKLVTFGAMPVDFSATFYGNAVTPAGLPTWQTNLQMTLLFPQGH